MFGLLVSILLASEGGPGSRVIIFTDGLASVGISSLDPGFTSDYYKTIEEFTEAKELSVSVISIEGDECRL